MFDFRVAEGARLESVYTATYREFESLTHRHILKKDVLGRLFCFHLLTSLGFKRNSYL